MFDHHPPTSRPRHILIVVTLVAVALAATSLLGPAAALAAEGVPELASDDLPAAELLAEPAESGTDWAPLRKAARRNDGVPVIVTLAIEAPVLLAHTLSDAEARAQERSIAAARTAVLAELGADDRPGLKTADDMPLIAFRATEADLAALRRSPHVVAVAEDREVVVDIPQADLASATRLTRPSDPVGDEGTDNTPAGTSSNRLHNGYKWWDYYRIDVDRARANGNRGTGQTIAVIDSGVDANHAWLTGKVVRERCYSWLGAGNAGHCPNGRYYQDGAGAARPCPFTGCWHGTHVAHTAAGKWGVASRARLIAVQVFHRAPNGKLTYFDSDLVWALRYVYNLRNTHEIAAVNLSLGGKSPAGYLYGGACDSVVAGDQSRNYVVGWINALKRVGIATVVASGNDNGHTGVRFPACVRNAITVGNTTLDAAGNDAVFGNTSGGSNSSKLVDVLAPGTFICSAIPDNRVYCGAIGTSMAAPHVAGAMALLRAVDSGATVDEMRSALIRSGPRVYDSRNGITRTRINVWTALRRI